MRTAVSSARLITLFISVLLFSLPHSVIAGGQTGTSAVRLQNLLNADGTLRTSPAFTGSVDPAGWKMTIAADGRPRFVQAAKPGTQPSVDTADVHWDNRFVGPYGIDGTVNAMAAIGADIYFTGSFDGTDKISASNIVRWNSSSGIWSALGDGLDATGRALAVIGTDLYVGGSFTHAGGAPARHIARWNGSTWSTLGTSPNDGVSSTVDALVVSGTNLFVGGSFTSAGSGTTANRIAKWDGSNWSTLGTGVSGTVNALAVMGSDLYAGGAFDTAGGILARRVARWTGSAWNVLGTSPNDGVSSTVYALAAAPPYLYVGGSFSTAGSGVAANYVARWNGTTWSALGNGFATSTVRVLLVNGASVYAGGSFTATGITAANRIAVWDTGSSTWSALNLGVSSTVYSLLLQGANLFAGGAFTSFTNSSTPASANHVARWTGSTWEPLGTNNSNSVDGSVIAALAFSGTDLYIGGSFVNAGPVTANHIVKYNSGTNTWTTLGSGANAGVDGDVEAIAIDASGNVYVGGMFLNAGGSPANAIAKWNGSAWSTLGTSPNDGVDGPVSAIAISGSTVFVGGAFANAGGIAANDIARWNGTTWSALGSGMNLYVNALAIVGSDLYAGGWFTSAGGTAVNYIAKWNGSVWSPLGTPPNDGTNYGVYTLAVMGSSLYVGGFFDHVAGTTIAANAVAKWNGSAWFPLGNGVTLSGSVGTINALCASGGSVYAAGGFDGIGILNASSIARWDTAAGGSWTSLGSGISSTGYALAFNNGDLFVGGLFTMAGSKPSFKLAHWNPGLVTAVKEQDRSPRTFSLDQNFPNPFNPATAISYQLSAGSFVTLEVFDILGREVATLVRDVQQPGEHVVRFDASTLSSGIYFYRLRAGDFTQTKSMILLK